MKETSRYTTWLHNRTMAQRIALAYTTCGTTELIPHLPKLIAWRPSRFQRNVSIGLVALIGGLAIANSIEDATKVETAPVVASAPVRVGNTQQEIMAANDNREPFVNRFNEDCWFVRTGISRDADFEQHLVGMGLTKERWTAWLGGDRMETFKTKEEAEKASLAHYQSQNPQDDRYFTSKALCGPRGVFN